MIDKLSLVHWQEFAPWPNDAYVEQDLIISRALVELYSHPLLKSELAFRGGTALQKCFFAFPIRYSEDLDFVQVNQVPIGPVLDAIREKLDPWLGKPRVKLGHGRATLFYRFEGSDDNKSAMRLKIEINTREHYAFLRHINKQFTVNSPWYSGNCEILTFELDELLGTKLRALFQRKKGRDLFDLARAIELLPINLDQILGCFYKYLEPMGLSISRAEFEANLLGKRDMYEFREDMQALLPLKTTFNFDQDFVLVMEKLIAKLPGDPWRGTADVSTNTKSKAQLIDAFQTYHHPIWTTHFMQNSPCV